MFKSNKLSRDPMKNSYTFSNLFIKLSTLLTLIVYLQLICLQQISARPKGLIYNKDGKFIYRPPKAGQGHIIVIDDRHRDSKPESDSQTASLSSESAYQTVQLINPRLYQPGGNQLAAAIPIRVGGYTQGAIGGVQLVSLAPAKFAGYPYSAPPASDQRSASSGTQMMQPSMQAPTQFQVVPVVQLYAPNGRIPIGHGVSTLAVGQQVAPNYGGSQESIDMYQHPSGQNVVDPGSNLVPQQIQLAYPPAAATRKAFEMESQSMSTGYDIPRDGYDQGANSAFLDEPRPSFNQHLASRLPNVASIQQRRIPTDMDYMDDLPGNSMDMFDEARPATRNPIGQPNAKVSRQSRSDRLIPGLLNSLTVSPLDQGSNHLRYSASGENPPVKDFKLQKKSSRPKAGKLAGGKSLDNLRPDEVHDLGGVREQNKDSQYWKQFRDQYDILQ